MLLTTQERLNAVAAALDGAMGRADEAVGSAEAGATPRPHGAEWVRGGGAGDVQVEGSGAQSDVNRALVATPTAAAGAGGREMDAGLWRNSGGGGGGVLQRDWTSDPRAGVAEDAAALVAAAADESTAADASHGPTSHGSMSHGSMSHGSMSHGRMCVPGGAANGEEQPVAGASEQRK